MTADGKSGVYDFFDLGSQGVKVILSSFIVKCVYTIQLGRVSRPSHVLWRMLGRVLLYQIVHRIQQQESSSLQKTMVPPVVQDAAVPSTGRIPPIIEHSQKNTGGFFCCILQIRDRYPSQRTSRTGAMIFLDTDFSVLIFGFFRCLHTR